MNNTLFCCACFKRAINVDKLNPKLSLKGDSVFQNVPLSPPVLSGEWGQCECVRKYTSESFYRLVINLQTTAVCYRTRVGAAQQRKIWSSPQCSYYLLVQILGCCQWASIPEGQGRKWLCAECQVCLGFYWEVNRNLLSDAYAHLYHPVTVQTVTQRLLVYLTGTFDVVPLQLYMFTGPVWVALTWVFFGLHGLGFLQWLSSGAHRIVQSGPQVDPKINVK